MNTDHELAQWRASWQAEETASASGAAVDVRRIVATQRRRMAASHIFGTIFAAALLIFSGVMAYRDSSTERLAWAAVIWTLTLVATGFLIRNWRGLWTEDDNSSSAFLALARQRCHASLRAVRFGYWLVAIELVIALPWLSWDYLAFKRPRGADPSGTLTALGATILLAAIYWTFFAFQRRRKLREMHRLEELGAVLGTEDRPEQE